jgi:membrane protein implicated in regulation of membrane protease activity
MQIRGPAVRELGKYLLWQLPGWVVAALVLFWLTRVLDLPIWIAAGLFVLFVAKDFVLFPVMRGVFSPSPHRPQPIGERGEAVEPLRPSGYIRVNGELWKARTDGEPIEAGAVVVVHAARGLTLFVSKSR